MQTSLKKKIDDLTELALGAAYVKYYKKNEIDPATIFYTSHAGAGMVGNPYAIFATLLKSDDFDKYQHVWQINDFMERVRLRREYSGCDNVKFVGKNSDEYFTALTSAKYIISNNVMPFFFTKKSGQIYVNTWNGIPLKKQGYDAENGKYEVRDVIRSFLSADYIISPCRFTTRIYRQTYKLDGIFRGKITECGSPRNDLLFNTDRDYIIDKLAARGTIIDMDKKVVLYAPTWKGTAHRVENDIARYDELADYLSSHIDTDKYQILIKPHPEVYKLLSREERKSNRYVSSGIDTDELLSITDILISDYSSVFFDFLLTNRPILFYVPALESVNEQLYFSLDELPGPHTCDMGKIAEWINDIGGVSKKYSEVYNKMKSWVCKFENGDAANRIINALLYNDESDCRIIDDLSASGKKRVLINGASFATNGVTTSLITLLNMMDYSNYDITLLVISDGRCIGNLAKVNNNVRVLCRCGQIPFGRDELFKHWSLIKHGLDSNSYTDVIARDSAYNRNFVRCFGNADFDTVVDYSGYGVTQPMTLLQCRSAEKVIWQHNDLQSDMTNKAKKKNPAYRRKNITPIDSIASLYKYFDRVVSCSEATMMINRKNMARANTYEKFTFCTNPVDVDRIREGCRSAVYRDGCFIDCYGSENEKEIPMPAKNDISFVTMGRFSPEKNHLNLIEAFAGLCKERDDCKLYIIGDGAMRGKYEKAIAKSGLEGKIILTGQLENPFGVMRGCNCFILPSLYEGMAMVVCEARTLGLAIILSQFDSVSAVSLPDGQFVTGHSVGALHNAMASFAEGKLNIRYSFSPDEFNKRSIAEFKAVL